jgi:hypothetical protein
MRDLIDLLENILLTEKSRGLLYRDKGDGFFQGSLENPSAVITFDGVDYYPSMPGAYENPDDSEEAWQQAEQTYPGIVWSNKPKGSSKAFAVLKFDGPKKGQKSYFGRFFNEIKPDMAGAWGNGELPGGWQLNKATSLKGTYYRLKPADLFPPNSNFATPAACVAELGTNPKNNPAVPEIMPGMKELLTGRLPTFENVGEMGTAIRDDLGETIGPIALIQGMIDTQGAEAARKDILGPNGSYSGASIYFPAAKNNGLVDSYITTPDGTEIGISSKGEKGALASVKNISDGIEVARQKGMTDLLEKYSEEIKLIEEVGKLSSIEFPLKLGMEQDLINANQAKIIVQLVKEGAKSLDAVPMTNKDSAVLANLMKDVKAKTDNTRYNTGYHILSSLARKVVQQINTNSKFKEACIKFLNTSPIIQLHLRANMKGNNVQVTGFDSKYPPDFKGTVGLDASKVYAATGIIGRVSFAYNPVSDGLPDEDETDNVPPEPAVIDNEKLDAISQQRSGIKASRMTTAPLGAREPVGDKQSLGRERRRR